MRVIDLIRRLRDEFTATPGLYAKDIDADRIVIGRSERGDGESLFQLSESPRRAPCPVLIAHPSGLAAGMTRRPHVCWT
jgi:hypothetical protein